MPRPVKRVMHLVPRYRQKLKERGLVQWGESTVPRPVKRVVHLVPKYRQKLKAEKNQTREFKQWTSDGMEELRGCF